MTNHLFVRSSLLHNFLPFPHHFSFHLPALGSDVNVCHGEHGFARQPVMHGTCAGTCVGISAVISLLSSLTLLL